MTEFVDQCRHEWRRLRVPDAIANEMAMELAADLREAERDEVSAEDVLGNSIFDPRQFADDWARERGVAHPRLRQRLAPSTSLWVAVLAVLAVFVAAGTVIFARALTRGDGRCTTSTVVAGCLRQPHEIGLDEMSAVADLQAIGMKVKVRHVSTPGEADVVVSQSPPAGKLIPKGATVVLDIRR
jgi:PASTA domain